MRLIPVFALVACNPVAAQLKDQRAAWEEQGIEDYAYTERISCFCDGTTTSPVRVTVAAGVVASAVYGEGATDVTPGDPVPETYEVLTVDGLFDKAEDAMGDADELAITFDGTYGFPSEIDIDWISNAVDDEQTIFATEFTPAE